MTCAWRHPCREEPTIRITYYPGRSDVFCDVHADAKCAEAASKGVPLTPEWLPGHGPELENRP